MRLSALVSFFLLSVAQPAAAVRHSHQLSPEDSGGESLDGESLEDWFFSTSGFDLSRDEAQKLAKTAPWEALAREGVPLDYLKQLRSVAYSSSGLDLPKGNLPDTVRRLAEVRADPKVVQEMVGALYSSSLADFSKKEAATTTLRFLIEPCQPLTVQHVKHLWQFLYRRVDLSKKDAQVRIAQAGLYGVLPDQLEVAYGYSQKTDKRQNVDEAMQQSAMVCRRYARDVQLYTQAQFQQQYPDYWRDEWKAAPQEKRVAGDQHAYSMKQFKEYNQDYAWRWNAAAVAIQQAVADDGQTYTMEGFQSYYKGQWQSKWAKAKQAPCTTCTDITE